MKEVTSYKNNDTIKIEKNYKWTLSTIICQQNLIKCQIPRKAQTTKTDSSRSRKSE